jgi:cold-inducible RNA-binding protein
MAQQNCKLYVGNLSWDCDDDDLARMFEPYGDVQKASITLDKETKKSRGFGFVEMESPAAVQKAIDAMNGTTAGGRVLTVNVARERERRQ